MLAFLPSNPTRGQILEVVEQFRQQGAPVLVVGSNDGVDLMVPQTPETLEPIVQIQAFYRFINALSLSRGHNPDEPQFLSKVTNTK